MWFDDINIVLSLKSRNDNIVVSQFNAKIIPLSEFQYTKENKFAW
ncbi:hypothetical protein SAMN05421800_1188 [Chryseobacterium balustinum]|uniref:Uncharacterized protein n=1 Tax=Chryseobacterium balustinum TaxID=246 RepID=A0AAX2IJA7_9FLAO|nr:hypothetical protein SAMN05421800_1188 [Chryseobacterium balustinum]SQA88889.1 Uncharacterised protein [Chryseobacterium balustinum]